MFRRRPDPIPEPSITRDEVLDIFGALADIYADTQAIRASLKGEANDDAEEDEP